MTEMTAKPQRQIHTKRLLLRGATTHDVPALHECFSDPELMKYWSSLPHETITETEKWVESMTSNPRNGVLDFLIIDKATSKAIGKIGIWSDNEIGFMIARSHWRKGLVSEALEAALTVFFTEEDMETIVADADPRNQASIGILKKFGFVETGRREKTIEIGGIWMDSLDLALTREAWKKSRKT